MTDITFGDENVFVDLGFSPDEAMNLKIKTDLILELRSYITDRGWTKQQASLFFNETQTQINYLINGDTSSFTVDKLLNMIAKAGMEVKIEVLSS